MALPSQKIENRFVGTQAAAEYSGIPAGTLRAWRCQGIGPKFYKPRGRALYDIADMDEFIRSGIGVVWHYLFYVNGRRYRGSTKTKNKKQAERIQAKARVAAESGESLQPKRAPLVQDFAKQFLEWLDKTTLEQKTKNDYKNGRRLILQSPLRGMRMDQITADDVETTKFHESPHSRNCAIRTLRRMLGKARDWKLIREVPRIKSSKSSPGTAW